MGDESLMVYDEADDDSDDFLEMVPRVRLGNRITLHSAPLSVDCTELLMCYLALSGAFACLFAIKTFVESRQGCELWSMN